MTQGVELDPLRILHVSEVTWGGVVTLLRAFVAEQSAAGHDVHVLAPASIPPLDGAVPHRWRVKRSHPWTVVSALVDLRRLNRSLAPDVIHLHSFVAGFIARLPYVRRLLGRDVALVYQPHAWSFDLYGWKPFGTVLRRWEASASSRVDELVANCQDEIDEGRSIGVTTPAQVLGVPVDIDTFQPVDDERRSELRQELGIASPYMVLCLGRLARQKGQDLLLAEWEAHRPADTVLALVGPGETPLLERIAPTQWGKTVHALGERHDVGKWLNAADVLVLPSRYETVGLVVAEALASGVPVVAARVNGACETICDGPLPAGGAVVPPGDMAAMVDEVDRRVRDPLLRQAEGKSARARAEAQFKPELVTARIERAYRAAIAARNVAKGGQ
jgi:glycosyltransferase involved in cell wall biosynthesis